MNNYTGVEIAIVGMSGRFPGASNVEQFWDNLKNGIESISKISDEDLLKDEVDKNLLNNPEYVKACSYIENKEFFDSKFFGYRPAEAKLMDPQIRIFHETCWSALEDAGYNANEITCKIGLFAGGTPNNNWENYAMISNFENIVDNYTAGNLNNITNLCARVAYSLNFNGPVVYINTACSTSLVAIQRACMSLLLRECNMALAGGITIGNNSKTGYIYEEGMILSKDGHCRTFDKDASGTVGSEGTGVIVLKKLSEALKDNDNIYAVIRGGAINNDGQDKIAYTAPSIDGQSKAILKAMNMAKVEPESISYVEAHGTGTKLGDPIEIKALTRAFDSDERTYCAIGSVKSNIGHTDVAAGVAGLIKTALSLKNKQIPASLHFNAPNPEINFKNSPFYVNTKLQDWKNDKYPLRAGVSSFGIGGTNAHLILEEAPEQKTNTDSRDFQLLPFSAKTKTALAANIGRIKSFLAKDKSTDLADIAYTLQLGRASFQYRKTIACATKKEAVEQLSSYEQLLKPEPVSDAKPLVVFMFSGQGSQYLNMCKDLYDTEPIFTNWVDKCLDFVKQNFDKDLKTELFSNSKSKNSDTINNTELAQPCLFIIEYALTRMLIEWGIQPGIMIGHSIGEYTAACISGVFTMEDSLRLVVKRGELMNKVRKGSMLGIGIKESELSGYLDAHANISLAAVNSTSSCVVSGEELAIAEFKKVMDKVGIENRILKTSHAFHSSMMDEILEEFGNEVKQIKTGKLQIPIISNLTGRQVKETEIIQTEYWVDHLRKTVRFSNGVETIFKNNKEAVFIEIGPGRTLSGLVRANELKNKSQKVVNLIRHPKEALDDRLYLLKGLGKIWEYGIEFNWAAYYKEECRRKVSLPTYSFDKIEYPVEVDAYKMIAEMVDTNPLTKKMDVSKWFYAPSWKLSNLVYRDKDTIGTTLIFSDEHGISDALTKQLEEKGEKIICVKVGTKFKEENPNLYTVNPNQKAGYKTLFSYLSKNKNLPDCIIHAWGISKNTEIEFEESTRSTYFYSLLETVKVCEAFGGISGKQLVLLTNDLHPILEEGNMSSTKSLSQGMLKVISQEYSSVYTSHIDINLEEKSNLNYIQNLCNEVQHKKIGKVISLRNSLRWSLIYDQIETRDDRSENVLKNEGVYLITGGLGELGFNLTQYLMRNFKAKVILLGRTKLPANTEWDHSLKTDTLTPSMKDKIRKLQILESEEGECIYLNCDISDLQEMIEAVKIAEDQFGAINGVVHAAGIVTGSSFRTLGQLEKKDIEDQFGPKMFGLKTLYEVFSNKNLDFCLLTSSLSSVLGGLRFGAYAPANTFMDYFVKSYHRKGQLKNWISINFDGLNFKEDLSLVIGREEFFEVFQRVLSVKGLPQIVVSTTDLSEKLKIWIRRINNSDEKNEINNASIENVVFQSDTLNEKMNSLSPVERVIASLWKNFFGYSEVNLEDDFFESGGDSLKALTIIRKINKELKIGLSLTEFFANPNIQKLSRHIESLRNIDSENWKDQSYKTIPEAVKQEYYPLSSVQKRLYFLYEFDKDSSVYNMPQITRLKGPLDKIAFESAFNKLIARHENLRTSFEIINGEPIQKINDSVEFEIQYYQLNEEEAAIKVSEFIQPFDLSRAPIIRIGLIRIAEEEHILLIDMHHIISDGVSHKVLIQDFTAFYYDQPLPVLRLQYKDYAVWEQSEAQQNRIKQQRDFWLNEFSTIPDSLELPTDFERAKVKGYDGNSVYFELSQENTSKLKSLIGNERTTIYMLLLAVFNILLSKLCNQDDIVVGTSTAGREHPDLESIIGMFVNTLPLRNRVDKDKEFNRFLSDLTKGTLACFDNQSYPYESLILDLKLERDTSHNPLFDVLFSYENFGTNNVEITDLTIAPYANLHAVSKFDLTLRGSESEEQLYLEFEYSTALFTKETILRFAEYFQRIINIIIENPDAKIADIDILTKEEQNQLLKNNNNTDVTYPEDDTIVSLFEEQARKTPDAIATEFEGDTLTFKELDELSNQLANHLIENYKIGSGDLIGIELDRNAWVVTCLLGIMKTGAAYVPIDPSYPSAHKQYIATDSDIKVLISEMQYLFDIDYFEGDIFAIDIEFEPNSNSLESPVNNKPTDGSLAYVIYTSGSTGKPKGVKIGQKSLVNYIRSSADNYLTDQLATFALYSSLSFDLTVTSIFTPLITGNTLVIYKESKDQLLIEKVIIEDKCGIIKLTPSHLRVIKDSKDIDPSTNQNLNTLIVGGEELPTELAAAIYDVFEGRVEIFNEYGPTEATVGCMIYKYEVGDNSKSVPIGVPIQNSQIYLLDASLKPVPLGIKGELYISGVGLALGYIDNEELTKERFIDSPFLKEKKMYRTGDLAIRLSDGNIVFKGRIDEQVKIRGYRIELGEIEYQLGGIHNITKAVVVVKERPEGRKLVGYYMADVALKDSELRSSLLQKLPDYMIPDYFVQLDNWPLTANGKLNKRALPDPEHQTGEEYIEPITKEEQLLSEVWSEVLGIQKISTGTNFFSIGGDSIKSIQISARVRNAGYDVSVKDILTKQSIKELALTMTEIVSVSDQGAITGDVELSPIQKWFFKGPIKAKYHFNQSVMMDFKDGLSYEEVSTIFKKIQDHHDVLRMVFKNVDGIIVQENRNIDCPLALEERDFRNEINPEESLLLACNKIQSGIDLENGPLMKIGLFHMDDGSRLLIVIHHLIVDGVSWRILFEDIETLHKQFRKGEALNLPLKTDSFQKWTIGLSKYSETKNFLTAQKYWMDLNSKEVKLLPRDNLRGSNTIMESDSESLVLSKEQTTKLLSHSNQAFNTQINDLLLTGLLLSIQKQFGHDAIEIDLEGHGREDILKGINISRTVGWFTSIYPVLLELKASKLSTIIKDVKERLRRIPNRGVDYLLNKYLKTETNYSKKTAQISFNYLGQFDVDVEDNSYKMAQEPSGDEISSNEKRQYDWEFTGMTTDGQLSLELSYSPSQYNQSNIRTFMKLYKEMLLKVIGYCSSYEKSELTPSDLSYKKLSVNQLDELQIKYKLEDIYPLSPMQEGLLFHALVDNQEDHYFEQITYQMKGRLEIDAVEKSMNDLIIRYPVLRTIFLHEGFDRPLQLVLKDRKIEFTFEDVQQACQEYSKEEILQSYQVVDRTKKFNLLQDSLMRVTVLQTSPDTYDFIWSHHHILMDGWCMSIIINDFAEFYSKYTWGKEITEKKIYPYSKYIQWLEERNKVESANYWNSYLSDYESQASVAPKNRLTNNKEYDLGKKELIINKKITNKLQKISKEQGVTLNSILQAAWAILLSKFNNTNDVVFGTVVSGRPAEIEGIETMVGLFINTVPVRITYDKNDNLGDLLNSIQNKSIENEQYHYHPLAEIQSLSKLGRQLLDHILVFENYPIADEIETSGSEYGQKEHEVTGIEMFEQTNYDLSLMLIPGTEINIVFNFNLALYELEYIEKISTRLLLVIEQMISNTQKPVSEIEIITEEEKHQILSVFNDTQEKYPSNETVISLFEKQVKKTPDEIAVVFKDEKISYAQLNTQANLIAEKISSITEGHGHPIGVLFYPCLEMTTAMLGILKSGNTYVPLSPDVSEKRNQYILSNCGSKLLLVQKDNLIDRIEFESIIEKERVLQIGKMDPSIQDPIYTTIARSPEDLVYIIYTSGTTGKPKGVEVKNKGIVNMLSFHKKSFNVKEGTKMSQVANSSFDASAFEIWPCLANGGRLFITPIEERFDPKLMRSWLLRNEIEISFQPTVIAENILQEEWIEEENSLRVMNVAGDRFHYKPEKSLPFRLYNLYGPTEDSIWSTWSEMKINQKSNAYSIGKPIANKEIYILNKDNSLQPIGVPGEICIAGDGLARGYVGNEDLTKAKFIENPFSPNKKLYKTGDLGNWLPDGNIEFLGRIDTQVKIRGFRIELGAIESQLNNHPHINESAVIDKEKGEDKYLIAYYVSTEPIDIDALKKHLLEELPGYMVPSYFMPLENLPITSNGKLDRKSLPDLVTPNIGAEDQPINQTQQEIVKIWAQVLKMDSDQIGINQNFFDIGGNSIKLITLVNQINLELKIQLSVAEMFRLPTVTAIAKFIEKGDQKVEIISEDIKAAVNEASDNLDLLENLIT